MSRSERRGLLQRVARRLLKEHAELTREQAVARFGRFPNYVEEIGRDDVTGTQYSVSFTVVRLKGEDELGVCVSPYPRRVRRARRLRPVAEFIEGFVNSPSCASRPLSS